MTNWNMRTEELELKDGSTIKNYHYEFNSTDRVLAKIVEDVFKGIMDIKADRKTENSSEKPNNCEPQTYVINPQEPTNDDKCFECDDFFTCGGQCNKIEDEPQMERSSE